jgi:hypothetical protein
VGRFWPTVTYTLDGSAESVGLRYVDLPDDPTLVISPEALAFRAGIPLPLSPDDRDTLIEAIEDAQADVVAYLGRPILPTTYTATGLSPVGDEWNLTLGDPIIEVCTVTAETDDGGQATGYFTVTYRAGSTQRATPNCGRSHGMCGRTR